MYAKKAMYTLYTVYSYLNKLCSVSITVLVRVWKNRIKRMNIYELNKSAEKPTDPWYLGLNNTSTVVVVPQQLSLR